MESVIATNVPIPTPYSDSRIFEKPTPTPDSYSSSFKKPTPTPNSDSSSFENRLRLLTPTPAEKMRLHRLQTPNSNSTTLITREGRRAIKREEDLSLVFYIVKISCIGCYFKYPIGYVV